MDVYLFVSAICWIEWACMKWLQYKKSTQIPYKRAKNENVWWVCVSVSSSNTVNVLLRTFVCARLDWNKLQCKEKGNEMRFCLFLWAAKKEKMEEKCIRRKATKHKRTREITNGVFQANGGSDAHIEIAARTSSYYHAIVLYGLVWYSDRMGTKTLSKLT